MAYLLLWQIAVPSELGRDITECCSLFDAGHA
jgi:hypothetical protein